MPSRAAAAPDLHRQLPRSLRQGGHRPPVGPEEAAALTFELTVHRVTPSQAEVSCIPDPAATYVLGVMLRSEYEEYASDQALIESDIGDSCVRDGRASREYRRPPDLGQPDRNHEYLYYAERDYYLYAYGLDADGTVTTRSSRRSSSPPRQTVDRSR
ncbi:MAG: hypothetical protein ACLS37_08230 [Alistipes sp.]